MSVRSHLIAAVLPLGIVFAGSYAWQQFLTQKFLETTQIDIHLTKIAMQTCGVQKLRSISSAGEVKDDSIGGFHLDFVGQPRMGLHIFSARVKVVVA